MAIGKINRSHYIKALFGVMWASALQAQSMDFKNGSDLLRAIPKTVGTLADSDPSMGREAKDAILKQFHQSAIKTEVTRSVGSSEEDAILAEAERLLHNELLSKASLSGSPQLAVSSAASHMDEASIRLSLINGRLQIQPAVLDLAINGGEADVSVRGLSAIPQVFLRDSTKLRWDGKRFRGLSLGKTEIYFVYANEMYILPVRITNAPSKDKIADLGGERLSGLKMPDSFAQMIGSPLASKDSGDLSMAEASLQVRKTEANESSLQKRFVYAADTRGYRDTAIQVMDVRSEPKQGKIFPLSGVTVQLMGLGIAAKTDATGLARFADLPAGSRLWAVVADEEGRIVPTANEIVIPATGKSQVERVRTVNYQTYVSYLNIFGADQNWANGSICARALDSTGNETLDGLSVQINDENADGPFYFSDRGPQPGQKQTGDNGRFCFFNVRPGLTEVSFFRGTNYQTALTLPVFPGAHSEEDLPLTTGHAGNLYLASFASAMDQLTGDDKVANTMESIPAANVVSIGENDPMPNTAESVVSTIAHRSEFKGRTYTLVQTAEFENTLQAQDFDGIDSQRMPVLPLLPRGFVEDVFTELNQGNEHASIAFDPALGQLVVMHKLNAKEDGSKLNIVVIDSSGRTINEGWYFGTSSQGLVKAVFFNLQPGMYSVKIQSADGSLSAIDTVAVDFWTTGFLQTGGGLQYDLTPAPSADEAVGNIDGN